MNYVAGLLFSENGDDVLVIKKKRPDWQAGKLNFIGGKIEEGETAHEAMVREFREETGLEITNWKHFATLKDDREYEVYFYVAQSSTDGWESRTDEKVFEMSLDEYHRLAGYDFAIPNTTWLTNMAINKLVGADDAVYTIYEN